MRPPPFHRRVLPLVFVIIFIIVAPALVFYTAGYRWNAKKGVIEVNGTLILDSNPRNASIKLNGKLMDTKTPTTLQRISPGTYTVEFMLDGYHPWSKELKVEAERVTFANDIILWPEVTPTKVFDGEVSSLISGLDAPAILLENQKDSKSEFSIFDVKKSQITSQTTAEKVTWNNLHWSSDAKSVVAENVSDSTSWLIRFAPLSVSKLPAGYYHWESGSLEGASTKNKIQISSTGVVQNLGMPQDTIDSTADLNIKSQPDGQIALFFNDDKGNGLILPKGHWSVASESKNEVLLQDAENWLLIDRTKNGYPAVRASGDSLLPLTIKRDTKYLLRNNNELYIWSLGQEPTLIDRQGQTFIAAAWHPEGRDIMAVSGNNVYIINLDPRNGYQKTILATFDKINDAVLYDDSIFVAGDFEGQTGLWKVPLTKTTAALNFPSF